MPASIVDADSLLAIDVGTVTTRAFFFDAVAGTYRFVSMGSAPSTYAPPMNDATEGVRNAIDDLQSVTGRRFISDDEMLITPATPDSGGVDTVAATVSAVAPLKILTVGLLEDVSLDSANNLASTIYSRVVDSISMNDRRKLVNKVDDILRLQPDLVIVAGGTENGASKSVIKLLDPVGLANFLTAENQRPTVLFAGNSGVAEEVKGALASFAVVTVAPNLRPNLESEQLGPAQGELRSIFRRIFTERDPGLQELDAWTSGRLLPNATGFGRMIRFVSRNESKKAVLGVDLGSASTVIAAAHDGVLTQRIYSRFGIGNALESLMRVTSMKAIAGWLPFDAPEADVRDYVLYKMSYPQSIPMTEEDAAMELALARELLRIAVRDAQQYFPPSIAEIRAGILPVFEPIIVSGSTLANGAHPGLSLLALLDALEPSGVTVFLLDTNNMLPALGAAAEINPILPVQVLETGVLRSLGTVISPVGEARTGSMILRVKAKLPSGEERNIDIKQGMLTAIPLEVGQKAELQLQPLQRFDVGLGGPGRGGTVKVVGGLRGVVIDARGRPLRLSGNPTRRREMNQRWQSILTK